MHGAWWRRRPFAFRCLLLLALGRAAWLPRHNMDMATHTVVGRIVRRRVLGKRLSFVTLELEVDGAAAGFWGAGSLAKVCFRRGSEWDELPRGDAQHPPAVSGGGDHPAGGAERPYSPFPERKSMLPPAARVSVELLASSCSCHPATSDLAKKKKAQQGAGGEVEAQQPPIVVRWKVLALGAAASVARGPGGSFSVSEQLKQRALAHAESLAAEARARGLHTGVAAEGATAASAAACIRLPLCRHWLLRGECAEASGGGGCGYRHEFADDGERARAKRCREARQDSQRSAVRQRRLYESSAEEVLAVEPPPAHIAAPSRTDGSSAVGASDGGGGDGSDDNSGGTALPAWLRAVDDGAPARMSSAAAAGALLPVVAPRSAQALRAAAAYERRRWEPSSSSSSSSSSSAAGEGSGAEEGAHSGGKQEKRKRAAAFVSWRASSSWSRFASVSQPIWTCAACQCDSERCVPVCCCLYVCATRGQCCRPTERRS
jgi:hypothetical protein